MEGKKVIHLPKVCRCGKIHGVDFNEFETAIRHNCYHDGGIIPLCSPGGELGLCAQCLMPFYALMDIPTGGTVWYCPVCFFSTIEEFSRGAICPCCGVAFDGQEQDYKALRMHWLMTGERRPEFVQKNKEPKHWNPWLQLAMSWRHEGVKCSKQVSPEEMEALFEQNKHRLDGCIADVIGETFVVDEIKSKKSC